MFAMKQLVTKAFNLGLHLLMIPPDKVRSPCAYPRAPRIQIILTLGPRVHVQDLLWAIWSLRLVRPLLGTSGLRPEIGAARSGGRRHRSLLDDKYGVLILPF